MIRKLQRKFVLAAMLSLLIVLAILIAVINAINYASMVEEADETLLLLADNGGSFPKHWQNGTEPDGKPLLSTEPDGEQPPEEPIFDGQHKNDRQYGRRIYSGELPFQSRWFSVTLNADGEAVCTDLLNVATVDEATAIEMAQAAQKRGKDKGFSDGYRYLGDGQDAQTQWLFLNREREIATVKSFLLISVLISLGGLLMVFVLMVLLSGRIVRPIAQSYEKQKRFITDAGHELKTPITIINADADVLEEELPDSEWIADIHQQTERLKTLTNNLIYLSKMEEEREKPIMIDFPLSEIVEDEAKPFMTVARTQSQTMTVSVQPMLSMNGDEASIRKLVTILLDNAVKYTPAGGAIALTLKKSGRQIKLTVENTAENVEKGSADRLFDRFYRTDASRNSETGGFGLGLAVAKAVTEAHRGRIHAESPDGRSLVVEATFTE